MGKKKKRGERYDHKSGTIHAMSIKERQKIAFVSDLDKQEMAN